jgi:hypothetical protein
MNNKGNDFEDSQLERKGEKARVSNNSYFRRTICALYHIQVNTGAPHYNGPEHPGLRI